MIGLMFVLSLALIMVKALGYVDWPWSLTLIPTWITAALIGLQIVVLIVVRRMQKKLLAEIMEGEAKSESRAPLKPRKSFVDMTPDEMAASFAELKARAGGGSQK